MTTLTAPKVQPDAAASIVPSSTAPGIHAGGGRLNLYKLGMLFVVKCRCWSGRAGNDTDELELTLDRIDARATGQDLAQQPDLAAKLSAACQALKNCILDPANVSALTGRLKRRVVLD